MGADDEIGGVKTELANFMFNRGTDIWLTLYHGNKQAGKIRITSIFVPDQDAGGVAAEFNTKGQVPLDQMTVLDSSQFEEITAPDGGEGEGIENLLDLDNKLAKYCCPFEPGMEITFVLKRPFYVRGFFYIYANDNPERDPGHFEVVTNDCNCHTGEVVFEDITQVHTLDDNERELGRFKKIQYELDKPMWTNKFVFRVHERFEDADEFF